MSSRRVGRTLAATALLAPLLASCRGSSAPPEKDWGRHVQEVQERGAPLVRAIYQFHATCGLWPYSLDELVPGYAGAQQVRGWDYTWHPGGWWYLTDFGAFPDELLRYKHVSDKKAGWIATNGEGEAWLEGGRVEPPAVKATDEERDAAHVAVLRARVACYKDQIIHHKGLVCWYYTHGDYQSARDACEKCLRRWPGHWWPNVMMSYIEFKLGRVEDADQRLARFAAEHDDLSHWYLAAAFHLETGRPEKARKDLARAAKAPLAHLLATDDDGEVLGVGGVALAWDAADLCYRKGWYEEALGVCDRWEDFLRKQGYGVKSYWAIRAACYLAQSRDEEARRAMDFIMEERRTKNPGVKRLEELDEAIKRKDHDFRYDSGDEQFSVLVDYK